MNNSKEQVKANNLKKMGEAELRAFRYERAIKFFETSLLNYPLRDVEALLSTAKRLANRERSDESRGDSRAASSGESSSNDTNSSACGDGTFVSNSSAIASAGTSRSNSSATASESTSRDHTFKMKMKETAEQSNQSNHTSAPKLGRNEDPVNQNGASGESQQRSNDSKQTLANEDPVNQNGASGELQQRANDSKQTLANEDPVNQNGASGELQQRSNDSKQTSAQSSFLSHKKGNDEDWLRDSSLIENGHDPRESGCKRKASGEPDGCGASNASSRNASCKTTATDTGTATKLNNAAHGLLRLENPNSNNRQVGAGFSYSQQQQPFLPGFLAPGGGAPVAAYSQQQQPFPPGFLAPGGGCSQRQKNLALQQSAASAKGASASVASTYPLSQYKGVLTLRQAEYATQQQYQYKITPIEAEHWRGWGYKCSKSVAKELCVKTKWPFALEYGCMLFSLEGSEKAMKFGNWLQDNVVKPSLRKPLKCPYCAFSTFNMGLYHHHLSLMRDFECHKATARELLNINCIKGPFAHPVKDDAVHCLARTDLKIGGTPQDVLDLTAVCFAGPATGYSLECIKEELKNEKAYFSKTPHGDLFEVYIKKLLAAWKTQKDEDGPYHEKGAVMDALVKAAKKEKANSNQKVDPPSHFRKNEKYYDGMPFFCHFNFLKHPKKWPDALASKVGETSSNPSQGAVNTGKPEVYF